MDAHIFGVIGPGLLKKLPTLTVVTGRAISQGTRMMRFSSQLLVLRPNRAKMSTRYVRPTMSLQGVSSVFETYGAYA